jgi:hypothetical protein
LLTLQALPLGALLQLGAAWATNDASQSLLPTWALLVLLAEAFYLARWLARRPALKGRIPLPIAIGALATLLLVWYARLYSHNGPFWQATWLATLLQDIQTPGARIEAPIGVIVLLALLWWRGLRLGQQKLEHEQVATNFKIGFAALVIALLLIGTVNPAAREGLAIQLGLTLPLFLFVGLLSLSLARLAEIQRGRRAQGTSQADPTRSWLMAMLALSGALVILIFGLEQAFSYHTLLGVVAALTPVWDGITAVIGWIVTGLAFILYWLLNPFAQAIQALFNKANPTKQPPNPPVNTIPPSGRKTGAPVPTEWLIAGQWVLIAIGVLILLVILISLFRRIRAWRYDETTDEERENLGAANVLGAQLRALLASLAARFQRKPSTDDDSHMRSLHPVRALYRRVLRQAAARGLGRHAAETPQEFALRLGPAVAVSSPGAASSVADPDLETLTRAYEQVRYGDHEPSAGELAALARDADRLIQRMAQQPSG